MTPQEQLRHKLCREAITRVGRAWKAAGDPTGLDMFTSAKLDAATDKIDATWKACQQGLASMDEFKAAVSEFETENYKAIAGLRAPLFKK